MSGDEPAGAAQGQQRITHIILRADGWFDGPDRVLPVAAYELNGRAMADSVVYGHAGFVPDYYLAGLGPEAAASAADLVTAGLWGRAEGGYRVLDQEVAAFLLERQRKSDEEAARARPSEGEGGRGPGRAGRGDAGSPAVRRLRDAVSPYRAGGARRAPRRVGAVARHGTGHLPAPRARTVVSAV